MRGEKNIYLRLTEDSQQKSFQHSSLPPATCATSGDSFSASMPLLPRALRKIGDPCLTRNSRPTHAKSATQTAWKNSRPCRGRFRRKPRAGFRWGHLLSSGYFRYQFRIFCLQASTPLKLRSVLALLGGLLASTVSNRYFRACILLDVCGLLNETCRRERHRFDGIKSLRQ